MTLPIIRLNDNTITFEQASVLANFLDGMIVKLASAIENDDDIPSYASDLSLYLPISRMVSLTAAGIAATSASLSYLLTSGAYAVYSCTSSLEGIWTITDCKIIIGKEREEYAS